MHPPEAQVSTQNPALALHLIQNRVKVPAMAGTVLGTQLFFLAFNSSSVFSLLHVPAHLHALLQAFVWFTFSLIPNLYWKNKTTRRNSQVNGLLSKSSVFFWGRKGERANFIFCSFPKWPQWLRQGWNVVPSQVCHVSDRNSSIWAIICCLPRALEVEVELHPCTLIQDLVVQVVA